MAAWVLGLRYMTQEQFEASLHEMFMPQEGDSEYERKKIEAVNLIAAAISDTTQYAGGTWDNDIAAERFKQWEWLHGRINPPKTISLPESLLHRTYVDYLKERGYTANKIPEVKNKRTPDFIVGKETVEFLNEFKAPELVFNEELGLYKFQTTHSKILTFISKAVKQFRSEDSAHAKPWVMTFASAHSQLNWTDFIQTLQGGVAYDNKLSPDFTNTEMFKRVISKAKDVDLYVWLQVNQNEGYIYQVSLIVNKDTAFKSEIQQIVTDLKSKDLSKMDNLVTLEWPS